MGEGQLPGLRLRHIGFIFQSFNLFPALTAYENVRLALYLKGYGWGRRRREAKRLLERVGLGACMNRKPSDLSGGQKQRILLARALYKQPKLLFLDEATSHLDVARESTVNAAVRDLQLTRIIVAHRPQTIASAERVISLEGGKVSQDLRVVRDADRSNAIANTVAGNSGLEV